MNNDKIILAVDSHFGVYAPQTFFERFAQYCDSVISEEIKSDMESGPDAEFYFESWQELESMTYTIEGNKYFVYQDDDIWLVLEGEDIENIFQ